MANLTTREVAEIQRRERENAIKRAMERREWERRAEVLAEKVEADRAAAQDALRNQTNVRWKRGPVEVLLGVAWGGIRLKIWVYGQQECDLRLARFDQKLVNDHIRRTLGNHGRETREGGALVGLKMLYLNGTTLRSPQRHTPWNGGMLTADRPPDSERMGGIYALWPARKDPLRMYGDLYTYFHPENGCLVRVLGTGRCVVGTKGWRAEHCMVTDIWASPQTLHRYSHFRERGIGVHDWDKKHGYR